MAVELDRTFLTYTAAAAFISPKVAEASGRTLFMPGISSARTRLGFLYPLCRPILSQNLFQIEENVKDYYQQFMTYYQSQGSSRSDPLSPRFYDQQKKLTF